MRSEGVYRKTEITMVATTISESMIIGGKRLVEEIDSLGFSPEAALWMYSPENGDWKLLLSFSDIERVGPRFYYEKIQRAISKLEDEVEISLDDVVLTKPANPVIHLLRKTVQTGPGIAGIRFSNNVVNGHLIEDAYIYRLG